MSGKPLVSAIIVFLNEEKFIEEAIESVFAQTYDNWELLLVDDGSTDASTAIARRYASQKRKQVRYLAHEGHENRGISASRNLGVTQAQGQYIACLDSDDVWFPHKLEEQVRILNSEPDAAMLYGATEHWYSWTGDPRDARRDFVLEPLSRANRLIQPPTLLPRLLRGPEPVPSISNVLVRREVVDSIGGWEDSFRGMYEDQVVYAKICLHAPVFVSGKCWDRYRQHPDSLCAVAKTTRQAYAGRLMYLRWLTAYLHETGYKETMVWKALREELQLLEDPGWLGWRKATRYFARRSRKLWGRVAKLTQAARVNPC